VVASIALRRPVWYPVLDMAMTEFRVRDVGTSHTPLIRPPGRIGPRLEEQGSHPGPLSFYLLAPVYRALGSSAWALLVGAVVLNLAALGAAIGIAVRRGGAALGAGVAAVLVLLLAGYGPAMLTEPWNPYLPLLWWVVLLLAVWAVACGDVAILPVAVFAADAVRADPCVVPRPRRRRGRAGGRGRRARLAAGPVRLAGARRVVRWSALSLGIALVLWLPPLVDQIVHDPGNLRAIYDHLATPSEPPLGPVRAVKLVLLHLDLPAFGVRDSGWVGALPDPSADPRGSVIPGLVVLALWAVAAVVAVRLRHRALMWLHLVVAVGLVASVASTSRIFGKDWYYLTLWAWGVAALVVLAIGWTAVAFLADRVAPDRRARVTRAVTVGLTGLVAVGSLGLAVGAVNTDPPDSRLSTTMAAVLPDTVAALERGEGPATGRDGRYMVFFSDTMYFGSQAYAIVDELERKGFDVGMPDLFHVPVTRQRVVKRRRRHRRDRDRQRQEHRAPA
jgi:hypothetical protein